MISTQELAAMSVSDLAQAAEMRHQKLTPIYQAMAAKVSKKSNGGAFLKDNNIVSADYSLKGAQNHPEIRASNFEVSSFEESIPFLKTFYEMIIQERNASVRLKIPRDIASQECCSSISYIRRRVKELEANPIFKMILQNEPIRANRF